MAGKKKVERPTNPGESSGEGKINTGGGDYVAGNQNKVNMDSVTGSTVVVGNDSAIVSGQPASATLQDLARLVGEMRALLPQARLDADTHRAVEGGIKGVEEQLKKPSPRTALVLPALKSVAETLILAASAGKAVSKLTSMIDQEVAWALTLLK
jgi:hypothetical protein